MALAITPTELTFESGIRHLAEDNSNNLDICIIMFIQRLGNSASRSLFSLEVSPSTNGNQGNQKLNTQTFRPTPTMLTNAPP